jgi:hypothetical protein
MTTKAAFAGPGPLILFVRGGDWRPSGFLNMKSTRMTVLVPQALYEKIHNHAIKCGITHCEVIRKSLVAYFARHGAMALRFGKKVPRRKE